MKKILIVSLIIIFIAAVLVGIFAIRYAMADNGCVKISGTSLVAVADVGYEFDSWSNGEREESISIFSFGNLFALPRFTYEKLGFPIISINTENSKTIKSKETYLNCSISVSECAEYSFDGAGARIRVRGNSTSMPDKKPYKIKFDEKNAFLGEAKAKEWTLIANHMDYSLMRNYLAYNTAAEVLDVTVLNILLPQALQTCM